MNEIGPRRALIKNYFQNVESIRENAGCEY